jgi:hypothetical protein
MNLTRIDLAQDDTPRFPLRLLIAGYGTGGLVAAAVFLNGGGLFVSCMTLWFGGAMATLAFGLLQVAVCKKTRSRHATAASDGDRSEIFVAAE